MKGILTGLALLMAAGAAAFAVAAQHTSGRGPDAASGPLLAPDGVPYDNERSMLLMQRPALSPNLLSNGSFERGRYWPVGWQYTDGLSTFWASGGTDGQRCLRIYTDVLRAQWTARQEEVRAAVAEAERRTGGNPQSLPDNPIPPAPERMPTRPPYYDTVAGLDGVHYRSEYIKVAPGAIYRFSIDARDEVDGEPKVFIKGFFDQQVQTRNGLQTVRRDAWHSMIVLDPCDSQWRRYAAELNPWRSQSTLDGKPLKPEWLQVQIYAYWRPGNYYFDNCRLEIIGYEDSEEPAKSAPAPKAREPLPTDGDFPILPP